MRDLTVIAKARLMERSDKYGDPPRFQGQKAWPFLYSFIRFPFQSGQAPASTDIYGVSSADAEGPDGISIATGATQDIAINLDEDAAFHLLYIHYLAWNPNLSPADVGSRELLLSPDNSLQGGRSMFDASMNQRVPYWTYLDVSAYVVSSQSRDLYGGFSRDPLTTAKSEFPIPALSMQGAADGLNCLRTPFQLAKRGLVKLRVTNNYTGALRVYGCLFGYKVSF